MLVKTIAVFILDFNAMISETMSFLIARLDSKILKYWSSNIYEVIDLSQTRVVW